MSELLHGNVSGLENPYQCVLDGLGLTDLRLNILVRPLFRWQCSISYPLLTLVAPLSTICEGDIRFRHGW